MRRVIYSKTFDIQLVELLEYGAIRFGMAVAEEKRQRVYTTIDTFLVLHPSSKRPDPQLGLHAYEVNRTPFAVIYDFDEDELRIYSIVHRNADRVDFDLASVEW